MASLGHKDFVNFKKLMHGHSRKDQNIHTELEIDVTRWKSSHIQWWGVIEKIQHHYSDGIMSAMESQITGISIVCSNVCSGANHTKHKSSASLALFRGIHQSPVVPITKSQ